MLFAWGALGDAWTMWIGEARTRIDPSHPDSLSLPRCSLLAAATATGTATGETGAHSNQTKATCATLSPLFTPVSQLCAALT